MLPEALTERIFLLYLTNDPERSTLSGSCLFKLVPRELFSSITRGPEDEVCIYNQRFDNRAAVFPSGRRLATSREGATAC